ncbi:Alpha/Beta hydrolase protein [Aspergillus crustosus]
MALQPGSVWALLGTVTNGLSAILGLDAQPDIFPKVTLDYGTFKGVADTITGSDNYLGIPFGVAPRFDHPYLVNETLEGVQDATRYGDACPQQQLVSVLAPNDLKLGALLGLAEFALLNPALKQSEDCLSINVQTPSGISPDANLPVILWIHGGGFSDGASAAFAAETTAVQGIFWQGNRIVQRSVAMDQPVIFVSANYRLNAFGLSGGREITEAGVANLALEDQRLAMEWVQEHISKFGGNPKQVTLFGESAGAWSVSSHLVANEGDNEDLFAGAIMLSGGPMKVDGQDRAQPVFDAMAKRAGCDTAADKLDCLRKAPFEAIYAAVQEQPLFIGHNSLAMPWIPRPEAGGSSPHKLASEGKIANVPIMIGDVKDEGTLFSLINQLNVTTDDDFMEYFQSIWWPGASEAQLAQLMELYPADPAKGSPFDTGLANAITPQFKRLAALIGDYSFQSQRRHLLDSIPQSQNAWTFEMEVSLPLLGQIPLLDILGLDNIPALGSFHASDVLLHAFGTIPASLSPNTRNIMSAIVAFANTLDPNNHGLKDLPHWPAHDKEAKALYLFKDAGPKVIEDTFRQEAMDFINENAEAFGI